MSDLREDVFCNNSECKYFDECMHNPIGAPRDGTKVIFINLEDTEFCEKDEFLGNKESKSC